MHPVTGYSIGAYGAMVVDTRRMEAYAAALRQTVTAQSVVLDIGAGTGIWSLLACKYGARKVYAVEPDDALFAAKEVAKANGYGDRIIFFHDISTRIEIPERADIIVSDLRGTLPFFEQHISSIADACSRHLAPSGVLIPQQDIVWACPVEAPETYQEYLAPWDRDVFGLDFSSNRKVAVNALHNQTTEPTQQLAEPQVVATLNYYSITNPNVRADLSWVAARAGTIHGISLWFDAQLTDAVSFSTAPGQKPLVYGMALLLLTEPVSIAQGDSINLVLQGNLVGSGYIWQWRTRILDGDKSNRPKAGFSQSTFDAAPLSMEQMRKRAANYVPRLNEQADIEKYVLNLIDGTTSLEEIARQIAARYPDHYATWQDALGCVGDRSLKHSK